MKQTLKNKITVGSKLSYNDGRAGHGGVTGTVVEVGNNGMKVQFEDRADTNYIMFRDQAWMKHITIQ